MSLFNDYIENTIRVLNKIAVCVAPPTNNLYYLQNTSHHDLIKIFEEFEYLIILLDNRYNFGIATFDIDYVESIEFKNKLWNDLGYAQYYYVVKYQNGVIAKLFGYYYKLQTNMNIICRNNYKDFISIINEIGFDTTINSLLKRYFDLSDEALGIISGSN